MGIVSESDSGILNKLAKECKDPRERDRLRALCILSIGYSAGDVSRMFFVDEETLYRWAQRWNEERSVEDRDRSGRPPALGEKEKKEIKRLLDENDPGKQASTHRPGHAPSCVSTSCGRASPSLKRPSGAGAPLMVNNQSVEV